MRDYETRSNRELLSITLYITIIITIIIIKCSVLRLTKSEMTIQQNDNNSQNF